ncbi:class I SAM-dependent methyltransferase [Pseudomonas sp. CGJS7]|uniref:class I SAM-dependent methyltransferase n=1 Tax=Pseudomonas sp. CGJS7 TaxID=3109348 RepID=UPI00300823F1
MSDRKENAEYWRARSGKLYQDQQIGRAQEGSRSYAQQEEWLKRHFAAASADRGRPIRVLDFGCGFGRLARILAPQPAVIYHGYDFSEPMVEPLYQDPPESLAPVRERVRVASSLSEAFAEERFDSIFTISVLIHNQTEDARKLVGLMMERLAPDGELVLIENSLSALSMKENNWHAGCWLHNFAEDIAPEHDIDVYSDAIDNHCVYVIRRARQARALRLSMGGAALEPVDLERLNILGLRRLKVGVRGLEGELASSANIAGQLHDHYEAHVYADKRADESIRRAEASDKRADESENRIAELTSHLQEARQATQAAVSERDDAISQIHQSAALFTRREGLRKQIFEHAALSAQAPEATEPEGSKEALPADFFLYNAPQDVATAHSDPRFRTAAHVFHMDWKGIRAAAGSLPGTKIAIRSDRSPSAAEVESMLDALRSAGIEKVVLHGMSDAMAVVHNAISRAGLPTYLVWHGTTAQWVWKDERRFALMSLRLAREGRVTRFSAIRRGLEEVAGPNYFMPQLLNPVPRLPVSQLRRSDEARSLTALVPSWNDLRKNLASNVLALENEPRIRKTLVFSKEFVLPSWLGKKVSWVRYPGVEGLASMLFGCDLVMNVTTIDCHPMVDLEAIAAGIPSIRGPLFLDALEDHPYFAMSCVDNPLSVSDIRRCVGKVLDVPGEEMRAMISDYAEKLTRLSLDRYAEFIGN